MVEFPLNENLISKKEKPAIPAFAKNWIITIGLIALLLAITIPIRAHVDNMNIILIYTLFVLIISSLTPGYFYGFVSAVLCTFLFDFFINPPWDAFEYTIKLPVTLFIMLIVTVASSAIAAYMKKITRISNKREEQANLLYEMTQELIEAKDKESIIRVANSYLASQLQRSVVFYIGNPQQNNAYVTSFPNDLKLKDFEPVQEIRTARHAYEKNMPCGYGTSYNGDHNIYYYPIKSSLLTAVVGVSCLAGPLDDDKNFISVVISQAILALEKQMSQEKQRQSQLESEREKTRNSLLRAISHDLRTPLTSISGASEALLDQGLNLDPRESRELIRDIKEETQWLIRIVENLLTVTRLIDTNQHINPSLEAAEEVVGQSVRIIRKWYPDWSIHVRAPEQTIFVPMDATLISQVLLNLLENAVKHSRPEDLIFVNLKKDDNYAVFEVSDSGTGISEDLLENLFDSPTGASVRPTDSDSGSGIGLSICSAIVKAHGGTIHGENKETKGASFTFKLPLERSLHEREDTNN